MLRFDPPENAIYAEKQPSKGHMALGWQRLEAWKGSRGYREIARDLGCSAGLLTTWKQGRTPAKHYLEKLEQLADVPPIAWKHWICVDPSKAMEFDENAPLTIEMVRAAQEWLRGALPRDVESAVAIRLVLALMEAREAEAFVSGYVPVDPRDTTEGLIAALLEDLESFARGIVAEMYERTARAKRAA